MTLSPLDGYRVKTSRIKAVIFDCDGTLVDSEGAHLNAWDNVLQETGKKMEKKMRILFAGKSDEEIASTLSKERLSGFTSDLLIQKKNRYFTTFVNSGLPPILGTLTFLHRLGKSKEGLGIQLGVASAANRHDISINLTHLNVSHLFDIILSGQEDLKAYQDSEGVNKPKPYIYMEAARQLNISTNECVVIEDSQSGVNAAADAGCFTIAIPNLYTNSHDFSKAKLVLSSLENFSVAEFFEMLNAQK